jgi:RecJ-like exonuclease
MDCPHCDGTGIDPDDENQGPCPVCEGTGRDPDENEEDLATGIHVALAHMSDEIPQLPACPDHPEAELAVGYGLAGGGMGPYAYCPICDRIINKTEDPF